ncbi:Ubiquitin carboxyl-terminal hydrolase 17-like protein B, partial [Frankliniella fusca]
RECNHLQPELGDKTISDLAHLTLSGDAVMSRIKYNHCDCGLEMDTASPHVSAALQALLHVPNLRDFFDKDVDHRTGCKSLLNCLVCAFHRLIESALNKVSTFGIVDASFFARKWRSLSISLPEERKKDPHEVLYLFLTRIRYEVVTRGEWSSLTDFMESPVTKIFYTIISKDVSCSACGNFTKDMPYLTLPTDSFSADLSADLSSILSQKPIDTCPFCHILQAEQKTSSVTLPKVLILHSEKSSPNFKWRGEVSTIRPGKFALSEYLVLAKLTLLYTKKEVTVRQLNPNTKTSQLASQPAKRARGRENEFKIIGFPNLDMVDPEPMRKQMSTQTPAKSHCDATTQTGEDKPLKKPKKKQMISFDSCKTDPKFKFFTGLSVEDFEALFNLIGGDDVIRHLKMKYSNTTPTKAIQTVLSSKDRLFMLLLRLRRGYPGEEIAFLFGIESSYALEICYVMTQLIYLTFKSMEKTMFQSAAGQKKNQPKVMRPFKNLRVILDGMSLYTQTPSNFEQQGNTYSQYKGRNVFLFAIGISTHGATIFCSDGFEGSMSDKETILQSGLIDMLEKGDGVMTDRGYELTAELQAKGCHFYKPPSLGNRKVFTPEEETLTKAIAAARIYVEHAIADIKDWKILDGTLPLNMISQWPNIVYILAFFRNFNPNRIQNKKFTPKASDE